MYRKLILCLCMVFLGAMASAQEGKTDKESKAKELSGMSILGNEEAPQSLYIVPWKTSEIGVETRLDMIWDEVAVPVDRDVFRRKFEFYQVINAK